MADISNTEKYKRGNTELLDALMWMCAQYMAPYLDNPDRCAHSFMSAGESAMYVLVRAGMAKEDGGDSFILDWAALEKRKAGEKS